MKILAVAALACGALLTGCGEDAEPSADPTGPPALTQAQYVEQANALCQKQRADVRDLSHIKTEAQYLRWVQTTAVPAFEADLRELDALVPPAELEAEVREMTETAKALIEDLKADPARFLDAGSFADLNRQTEALGLDECAG